MPSVISISMALNRSGLEEQVSGVPATFPSIDPLDAYYLLNPSGDLSGTQVEFEEWFKNKKWEVIATFLIIWHMFYNKKEAYP